MTPLPVIERFRHSNTGVPFVHALDSGQPGPTVVVNALTHGNEVAGAAVLCRLLDHGPLPARGRLLAVFANHAAHALVRADDPAAGRMVERDFNRVWDPEILQGSDQSWEARRARELLPVYESATALLDLHTTATADPPFLIASAEAQALALLEKMPVPLHRVLMPRPMHLGRLLIESRVFSDTQARRIGIVAECGPHRDPASVEQAWNITLAFLRAAGLVEDAANQPPAAGGTRYFRVRELIVPQHADFRFVRPLCSFAPLERQEAYAEEGDTRLRAGFDRAVMLMPRVRPQPGLEAGFLAEEIELAREGGSNRAADP
jgi:succinylglutamate desuccinylase